MFISEMCRMELLFPYCVTCDVGVILYDLVFEDRCTISSCAACCPAYCSVTEFIW